MKMKTAQSNPKTAKSLAVAGSSSGAVDLRTSRFNAGFRAFADSVNEPVTDTEETETKHVDLTRIRPETVYQICNHRGPRRRYVRVVEVYGENEEDAVATCEIIHADDETGAELVGSKIKCALSTLQVPDQYPKYQFSPEVWKRKVSQPLSEKKKEVEAVIASFMLCNGHAIASGLGGGIDVGATLGALAKILKPIFGGLTLVLMLSWIKRKIESMTPSESEAPKKTFKQKYSDMFRAADKKKVERLTFRNPQAAKFGISEKEQKEIEKTARIPNAGPAR
jgi:hypothetical protein